jgi:hypothetical protein
MVGLSRTDQRGCGPSSSARSAECSQAGNGRARRCRESSRRWPWPPQERWRLSAWRRAAAPRPARWRAVGSTGCSDELAESSATRRGPRASAAAEPRRLADCSQMRRGTRGSDPRSTPSLPREALAFQPAPVCAQCEPAADRDGSERPRPWTTADPLRQVGEHERERQVAERAPQLAPVVLDPAFQSLTSSLMNHPKSSRAGRRRCRSLRARPVRRARRRAWHPASRPRRRRPPRRSKARSTR